jgi:hypothetical protein
VSSEKEVVTMKIDVAVIKTDVGHIKEHVSELAREQKTFRAEMNEFRTRHERDFRILFAALISVALGLSAVMAKGFGWIH